jgi:hypothetical protein
MLHALPNFAEVSRTCPYINILNGSTGSGLADVKLTGRIFSFIARDMK